MSNKEISIGVKLVTDLADFTSGFKQAQDTSKKFGEGIEKNVSTPLNKLAGQLRTLKAAQSRSLTPEQFTQIGTEITKVQGEIDKFKGKLTQTSSPLDGLLSQAKGLLPAFGFAAIAAGAGVAVKSIIASTSATADEWEFMMSGLKTGVDQFWKTLATGDWSNFTDRIKEAIQAGYDYSSMMDKIQDQTRALSMIESDAAEEAIDLEIKLRNKLLTREERIKAGQDRIALEAKLVKERKLIADENYKNEYNEAMRQTGLGLYQLEEIAKDIASEKRLKAEAYNDKVKEYEKLKALNTKQIGAGTGMGGGSSIKIQLPDTPEIIALKSVIDSTDSMYKEYAVLINKYDILNDESQKKFTEAYAQKNLTAISGKENIKKIISQVNSLLAGEEITGQKIIEKNSTIAGQIKTLQDQIELSNGTDKEAIAIAYQKIEALNKQAEAYDAVKRAIRAEATGNTALSPITSKGTPKLSGTPIDTKTLAVKSLVNADSIKSEIDAVNEAQDRLIEKQQAVQDAFQSGFENIGQSVVNGLGFAKDGFEGFVAGLFETVTKLIAMMLSESIANSIAGATASGAATGPAAIFTTPAFIATAVGGVLAAFAAIPKFATGGIVPGSSWTGDNVLARVNSGEEILTRNDPRHRANQSQSNSTIILQPSIDITGDRMRVMLHRVDGNVKKRT